MSFAINVIRSYDAAQSSAAKSAIRSAKRMAYKIHHGIITCNSRRRPGSWITQSNETARNGPSECNIFCKNIVHLNQRRLKRSRLSRPSITTLENARVMIISCNSKSLTIGSSALTSTVKVLSREYRRLQLGFYLPHRFRGHATSWFLAPVYPLVRFSPHYVLSDGSSFLDIGVVLGIASALAARTPAVRITAIEPDSLNRYVLRITLASVLLEDSAVLEPPTPSRHSCYSHEGSPSLAFQ